MKTNGTVKVIIPGRGRIPRLGGLGPKMSPTDVTFQTFEAIVMTRGAAPCSVLDPSGNPHPATRLNYKDLFDHYSSTATSAPDAKAEEKKAEEKVEDKKEPEAPVEEAPETPVEEIEGVNKFPDDDPEEETPAEEAEEQVEDGEADTTEETSEENTDENVQSPKNEVPVVNKNNSNNGNNNNRNNGGKKKNHK